MTVRGTHKKEFMGIKPTGNQITSTSEGICHIIDGKIHEWWFAYNKITQEEMHEYQEETIA